MSMENGEDAVREEDLEEGLKRRRA